MIPFRLGLPFSTTYLPDRLIEGYSTFIWSERYSTDGDFVIKSYYIDYMLDLLPENCLVSHANTDAVGIVEDRMIDYDSEGRPEVTITGRMLNIFTEHRTVYSLYQQKRKLIRRYTPSFAAGVLLWNAFANNSGQDVTTEKVHDSDARDFVPNLVVTDSSTRNTVAKLWYVEQGSLKDQLQTILEKGDISIRCRRPRPGYGGNVLSVDTSGTTRGTVTSTYTPQISSLQFDVYNGIDRTSSVEFNTVQGHLLNESYLNSVKDYKTAIQYTSKKTNKDMYRNPIEESYSGLQRRVTVFDAGDIETEPEPKPPKHYRRNATKAQKDAYALAMDEYLDAHDAWENRYNDLVLEFQNELSEQSDHGLSAYRRVSLFTGDVSPFNPYKFKVDYDLGDTVMLRGKYGELNPMVVSEYTITDDAEGEKAYPGLVTP